MTTRHSIYLPLVLGALVLSATPSLGADIVWERSLDSGEVDASPVAADLDGDGELELVLVDTGGGVQVWDLHGKTLTSAKLDETIHISPSVADLIPGGGLEICVMTQGGLLACLDRKAEILWTYQFPAKIDWGRTAIAIDDVDRDGALDIFTGCDSGRFVRLSPMGGEVWRHEGGGKFHCPPALVDLDEDGSKEIVITTGAGRLECLSPAGKILWETELGCDNTSGPVVTDLDGDGELEILVGGFDGALKCFDARGKRLWQFQTEAKEIDSSITVGDVDRDGKQEIFFVDIYGTAYLLDAAGKERWRYFVGARCRRPAALADFDADGDIEIFSIGYSENAHLFAADGTIEERFRPGGSTNSIPLVVEIDGRLAAICPLDSGKVVAYSWMPPSPDTQKTVLWGAYRRNPANTGVPVESVSENESLALKSVSYGDLTVGPNRFMLEIANPEQTELAVDLEVKIEPTGQTNVATTTSRETTVLADMQYLISGTYPETVRFGYTVTETKKKRVVLRGKKVLCAEPFQRDITLTREAIERLASLQQTLAETYDIHREFIIDPLAGCQFEYSRLQASTEKYLSLNGNQRLTLARQLAELAERAHATAGLADVLLERAQNEKPVTFAVWESNPWAPLRAISDERAPLADVRLQIRQYQNEYESRALNIVNLSDTPMSIRVNTTGPLAESGHLQVREVISVPSEMSMLSADAIAEMNQGRILHLAPAETRQLWLTTDANGQDAGTYSGSVDLHSLTVESQSTSVAVEQTVLPLDLQSTPAPRLCSWGYVYGSVLKDDEEAAHRDLVAHGNNVFVITTHHLPKVSYDAAGNITEPLDFARHDRILNLYKQNGGFFLFFNYQTVLRGPEGHGFLSEAWHKAHETFLDEWVEHLAKLGIDYDDFALYPVDEPGLNPGLVERQINVGKAVREADSQILLYTDPVERTTLDEIKAMAPYVDIWCPNRNGFLRTPNDPRLDVMRERGLQLWTYECEGNAKHQSPLGYYRALGWVALHNEMNGIGFWSYCTSRHDPWFLPKGGHDYLLIYGGDGVVSSKRWEAVRDGLEDMRAVWLLQEQVARARDAGVSKEQCDEAQTCLSEAIAELHLINIESERRWSSIGRGVDRELQAKMFDTQRTAFDRHRHKIAEMSARLSK